MGVLRRELSKALNFNFKFLEEPREELKDFRTNHVHSLNRRFEASDQSKIFHFPPLFQLSVKNLRLWKKLSISFKCLAQNIFLSSQKSNRLFKDAHINAVSLFVNTFADKR